MMERYACSLFITLLTMASYAQVRVVEMTCDPCPSIKLVVEAATHFDAQARASGEATRLKIRLDTPVSDAELISTLSQVLNCDLRGISNELKRDDPSSTGTAQPSPCRWIPVTPLRMRPHTKRPSRPGASPTPKRTAH